MNHLSTAHSPYLRQHANNPVEWYAWGEEALQKAKQENKLILVSIGYAACHWCHVMERECFEDEEVAEIMNRFFVNIKVDREERPDIDKFYMDAVQIMTQQGGWPLNCIALPDGRPIYGGTYFPKNRWMQVLLKVAEMFQDRPAQAEEYGNRLTTAIQQISDIEKVAETHKLTESQLQSILDEYITQSDVEWGGRLSSHNKFPLPVNQAFLMRALFYTQNPQIAAILDTTLQRIALGGIYDHIGGGFARYATDSYWKVPHFEKMLYDNAQLVSLYSDAYRFRPHPAYKQVVYDTISFVQRELSAKEGGFYASLDADSEGVEGKFYVWTKQEITNFIQQHFPDFSVEKIATFCEYYEILPEGNWEDEKNVFFVNEYNRALTEEFEKIRKALLVIRENRIRPALDDKILASWNGLMIKGLVDAYKAFGEQSYLDLAEQNAQFIWDNCTGSIPRAASSAIKVGPRLYRNTQRSIFGFLDDYANVMEAYLILYAVNFDAIWVARAELLLNFVMSHFYDETSGMFFYTEGSETEIVRKYEVSDDVIPSACSVLAHVLYQMYHLKGEPKYEQIASQMLQNNLQNVLKHTYWYGNWAALALKSLYPQYEVVFTGSEALALQQAFHRHFLPNCLVAGTIKDEFLPIVENRVGETSSIYVCENQTCHVPVRTIAEALSFIE